MNVENMMMEDVRRRRNQLLQESDWTQFNDSPLTDAKKTEWATYRQSLRDITSGLDFSGITLWDGTVCETYMPTKPN
jgi:hypothetical protein